jgi:hypothetical protein
MGHPEYMGGWAVAVNVGIGTLSIARGECTPEARRMGSSSYAVNDKVLKETRLFLYPDIIVQGTFLSRSIYAP